MNVGKLLSILKTTKFRHKYFADIRTRRFYTNRLWTYYKRHGTCLWTWFLNYDPGDVASVERLLQPLQPRWVENNTERGRRISCNWSQGNVGLPIGSKPYLTFPNTPECYLHEYEHWISIYIYHSRYPPASITRRTPLPAGSHSPTLPYTPS